MAEQLHSTPETSLHDEIISRLFEATSQLDELARQEAAIHATTEARLGFVYGYRSGIDSALVTLRDLARVVHALTTQETLA